MNRNQHHEIAVEAMKVLAGEPEMLTEAVGLATIQTNAILALAYEQRTANLIALLADEASGTLGGVDYASIAKQVIERLGA